MRDKLPRSCFSSYPTSDRLRDKQIRFKIAPDPVLDCEVSLVEIEGDGVVRLLVHGGINVLSGNYPTSHLAAKEWSQWKSLDYNE